MIKACVTLKTEQAITVMARNWDEFDKKVKEEIGFDNVKAINAIKTPASDIRQGRDK